MGWVTALARLCRPPSVQAAPRPTQAPPPTHPYVDPGKLNSSPALAPTTTLPSLPWWGGGDHAGAQILPHHCLIPFSYLKAADPDSSRPSPNSPPNLERDL